MDEKTTGFTSETAKAAASKPRLGEQLTVKRMFVIRQDQADWLDQNSDNRSALMRELLDKHIKGDE